MTVGKLYRNILTTATVYKYRMAFSPAGRPFKVQMPKGADILTIGSQRDGMVVWALVNPEDPPVDRTFVVYGTGRGIEIGESSLRYWGTIMQTDGTVWHLFEIEP